MANDNVFLAIVSDEAFIRINNLRRMQKVSLRAANLLLEASGLVRKMNKPDPMIEEAFSDIIAFSKSLTVLNEGYVPDNIPAMENLLRGMQSRLDFIRTKLG